MTYVTMGFYTISNLFGMPYLPLKSVPILFICEYSKYVAPPLSSDPSTDSSVQEKQKQLKKQSRLTDTLNGLLANQRPIELMHSEELLAQAVRGELKKLTLEKLREELIMAFVI